MRKAVPLRSLAWWVIVLSALAAVAIYMVFEVLDLDGSDLQRRILQPPISSQPSLAESDGATRHGVFMVRDALGILQQRFAVLTYTSLSASPNLRTRLTTTRPRGALRRVSFTPPPAVDDPHLRFAEPSL